jgi:16S rRNA (adenine1518-N6/adenine1519-N6)-dimethyltransferase
VSERDGATDGLPPLRDVIAAHGLAADKKLGQNFILDLNLTRRIARAAGPLGGRTVVEIGPGPGGLTRGLLMEGAARVVAIERDERCRPALDDVARAYPGRLDVRFGDATRWDFAALARTLPPPVRIAANLPYNVATTLLIGWLETEPWPPWFDRMALMFQKEVADRIVAEPNTSAYGRLSVIAQWRCRVALDLVLPPAAFTPPPKISSAVVTFVPRPVMAPACSVSMLGRVTAAAFGQRRKMLRQSLKTLRPDAEVLLAAAGLDGTRRGETLTVHEFGELARIAEKLAP